MSNRIALDDWLEAIDREYLADFIGAGGAAVKLLSPRRKEGSHCPRH